VSKNLTRRFVFVAACLSVIAVPAIYRLSVEADTSAALDASQDRSITPAGRLIMDASNGLPAVAPLTMNFVRTPDTNGPDGKGRYLIAVNSGWGIQQNSRSRGNQTLSIIDLNKSPDPQVIQNVWFPAPQSANVGIAFDTKPQPNGRYRFFVSGGFENKVWILSYDPAAALPISPANQADKPLDAPYVDISAAAENAPSPNYNSNVAAVYPTGIALSPDAQTLYTANNLGDSLAIISDLRDSRKMQRVGLQRHGSTQFVYPYDVKVMSKSNAVSKIYVSLWGDGSVAVVNPALNNRVTYITVDRHPTLMMLNRAQTRLYVVNSDADSVSVIDTATDKVIERIDLRLNEKERKGVTPEGLALSDDEQTLYVANSHANAVAVVGLEKAPNARVRSKLLGLIPTGNYPSALAFVGKRLFIANGKGTGMENSSNIVNQTGMYPNMPNSNFPGDRYNKQGMHPDPLVEGNISMVSMPDEKQLYDYTQRTMRNNGMLATERPSIFPGGKSPFKHVIYIIRENRTYDQVFGDLERSGDGSKADGEPLVAIFGAGKAARSPSDAPQDITPNARAIALRFGLLDRFFVNAEASPDGHNWSTAAFSSDYIDKAFRWEYSSRGRTYDYEGFNRLPDYEPSSKGLPSMFGPGVDVKEVENFLRRFVPYLHGSRDIGEPQTLYLWDAAARAGLTYRNYGEFIATLSEADIKAIKDNVTKSHPDLTRNASAFPTKKSLEGHFNESYRNFDMDTPDSMTIDSYKAAKESNGAISPIISNAHSDQRFRGNSRFGVWLDEFRAMAAERSAGTSDRLPNLSIVRLSNDHTEGLTARKPTPQFFVADNDYAVGLMVEAVSNSPYWKDTAIMLVEDDAQDGPDHVDAHRSVGMVISAYNRPGALIHEFHNTVSLIRTMEMLLGIPPMNQLDGSAVPMNIFQARADLRPYKATLPEVSLDNLMNIPRDAATAYWMKKTEELDLVHADMADPGLLNQIIWFSVRPERPMPGVSRLPAFDAMRLGVVDEEEERIAKKK